MTFGRVVCARKPVNRLEMLVPLENWSGIKMFWIRHTGLIEYIFEEKKQLYNCKLILFDFITFGKHIYHCGGSGPFLFGSSSS